MGHLENDVPRDWKCGVEATSPLHRHADIVPIFGSREAENVELKPRALEDQTEPQAMRDRLPGRGTGDTFSLRRGRAGGSDGAPGHPQVP